MCLSRSKSQKEDAKNLFKRDEHIIGYAMTYAFHNTDMVEMSFDDLYTRGTKAVTLISSNGGIMDRMPDRKHAPQLLLISQSAEKRKKAEYGARTISGIAVSRK
jgi:aromatic ring hydroxylase